NIQTLKNNLTNFSAIIEKSCGELTELDSVGKQIDPELLEINAAAREKILKDVQFLNRTIEAMQKAESRTDLMKYATDAQIVLDCILVYMAKTGIKNQTEQQLEAEIPQLKGNIQAYANHHREIMTSLQDKKNALYLSSALEAAAAVSVAPIAHIGGGDFAAKLASASITVGAAPGIVTGIEVGSQKLGLGLQAVMNETPEVTGLANVRLPSKNYSVSDLYTFTAAQIKKSATDPESIIQYQKTALLTGLALLVPALAIPIAVAITGERVGKIAYRAHSHNQLFKKAEIKALDRMAKHETEMQAYLRDHPNHRRYEERRQNWESKQLGAKASDEKAVRPKLK
ncbi:MAG TPA: hypothetical protein VLH77_00375, partial [Gammaproteobacteria bacterium]|nr:hypothetical protein [Gammaproteobacteria bacterium]